MHIILILGTILIIAISTLGYIFLYKDLANQRYTNFISASTFSLFLIYYMYQALRTHHDHEWHMRKTVIDQNNDRKIGFEKLFVENYPYLERLYKQLNNDNDTLKSIPSPSLNEEEKKKRRALEINMCAIIFQMIENIYTENKTFDPESPHNAVWIHKWKTWFKGPIIREQWSNMKENYTRSTQIYIDNNLL